MNDLPRLYTETGQSSNQKAHMLETYLKIKLSASTKRNTTSKQIFLKRNIPQGNSLPRRSSQSVTLFLGPLQESLIHGSDIDINGTSELWYAVAISGASPAYSLRKQPLNLALKQAVNWQGRLEGNRVWITIISLKCFIMSTDLFFSSFFIFGRVRTKAPSNHCKWI